MVFSKLSATLPFFGLWKCEYIYIISTLPSQSPHLRILKLMTDVKVTFPIRENIYWFCKWDVEIYIFLHGGQNLIRFTKIAKNN